MKEIYRLRWVYLEGDEDGGWANGRVYGNPKFFEGYSIHTSWIQKMSLEGTELTIHTRNSIYQCSLEEFSGSEEERQQTVALLKVFLPNFPEEKLGWVEPPELPSNREMRLGGREGLSAIGKKLEGLEGLAEGSYILCVDSRHSYDYFFSGFFQKTAEGAVQLVLEMPYVHLGMFQDSVLCHNELAGHEGYFDLRYFPQGDGIKLYHALYDLGRVEHPDEEALQAIRYVVCNVGDCPIRVDDVWLNQWELYPVDGEID